MRTTSDRIRHAISFELLGLAIVTPLGALGFGLQVHEVGVMAVVGASIATGWNYLYNLLFDRVMKRVLGTVRKTMPLRVLHAVLFEGGLLIMLLPFIAWYLDIGLGEALVMEIAFALFYLVYAFVFNWAYDRVFPLPLGA
ncbi:PACE efflux transporter [Paracoccus aestuariivivens]|uniref:PACE efflux transporter n=1 Tax=Paracoccus aestuariivivens TaxID=1820333 RepID=A0A6L6J770_9RHOB|nr:PACE efflux transporter [Paracoccus aestuariivivens]MTH77953.1 PACE efflux transporter [Paracoccus aestuariivivens]